MRDDVLDFFDVTPAAGFDVPPEQAQAYFRAKGLKASFAWEDMIGDEHAAAFTVAKMMDLDLLSTVRKSLDDALAMGVNFRDWSDQLIPTLQQAGWWGRKAMIDPLTGETVLAELGSPARLQTIFRTNMQSAYAAGQWVQMQDQAEDAPFLLYDAVDDYRTRPEHAAWDGTCLPMRNKWWKTHYPPNGWNCRCTTIQLDADDLDKLGITVSRTPGGGEYRWTNPRTGQALQIPDGVDPGFNMNHGTARVQHLEKLLGEKVQALPDAEQAAAKTGVTRTKAAIASTVNKADDKGPKNPEKVLRSYGLASVELPKQKDAQRMILDAFETANRLGWPMPEKLDTFKKGGSLAVAYYNTGRVSVATRLDRAKIAAAVKAGHISQDNPVLHELAHLRHESIVGVEQFGSGGMENWLNNFRDREVAERVSRYARTSPREFVAETLSGIAAGKEYDADVMALLQRYTEVRK